MEKDLWFISAELDEETLLNFLNDNEISNFVVLRTKWNGFIGEEVYTILYRDRVRVSPKTPINQ